MLNICVFQRVILNKITVGSVKENIFTAYIILLGYKRPCLISSLVFFVCLRIYFVLGLYKRNLDSLKKSPTYFIEYGLLL